MLDVSIATVSPFYTGGKRGNYKNLTIYLGSFLRHVDHGSLEHLQERLLHTFSSDIACARVHAGI